MIYINVLSTNLLTINKLKSKKDTNHRISSLRLLRSRRQAGIPHERDSNRCSCVAVMRPARPEGKGRINVIWISRERKLWDGKNQFIRSWNKKKRLPHTFETASFQKNPKTNYFTFLPNSAPALNFTTFLAGIFISLPFCGLRPFLAALLLTEKEPKPTKATLSPFDIAFVVAFTNAFKALLASAFVIFASEAIEGVHTTDDQ